MQFLTDANVFVPMVLGLRNMGHDVLDFKEEGLESLSDSDLFHLAQDKKRNGRICVLSSIHPEIDEFLIKHAPVRAPQSADHSGIMIVLLNADGSHQERAISGWTLVAGAHDRYLCVGLFYNLMYAEC
jgi:hypothetical protein